MPIYDYAILVLGFFAWLAPLVLFRKSGAAPSPRELDRRARWGLLLQASAYAVLWQSDFWRHSPPAWRVALSIVFHVIAIALAWSGVRALGKQWRLDAGLNADHQLVRTGVYAIVRHPIYSAMLCLLLGQGFMVAPWPLFAIAVAMMVIGTEIRVRIEERLLRSRFGAELDVYRANVGAYLPRFGKKRRSPDPAV